MKRLFTALATAIGFASSALAATINLSNVNAPVTLYNNDIVTGTLAANVKISIANNAEVVLSDVNINDDVELEGAWAGLTCLGNATIVLEGENAIKGIGSGYPGIYIPSYAASIGSRPTLTIQGAGTLSVKANGRAAAIGGGGIAYDNDSCGNIVIVGGTIVAGGTNPEDKGEGAGIGGSAFGDCGDITITGGNITAYGGLTCAGIGGSTCAICGNITISGGLISATGGEGAPGIGAGGDSSTSGNITITGGDITARGGDLAAGIGSGRFGGKCGDITINAGITRVAATRGSGDTQPVGAGYQGRCGVVTLSGLYETISGNTRTYFSWNGRLSTLTGDAWAGDGMTLSGTLGGNYKVSIADGATVTLSGVTINRPKDSSNVASYKWAGLTCVGDATINLAAGTTNTVKGFWEDYPGIFVPTNKTLTIGGTGALDASSNGWGAGIGGGYNVSCGNIVLRGGDVSAHGGGWAAGIGGGANVSCGDIVVEKTAIRVVAWHGNDCNNNIGAGTGGSGGATTVAPGLTDVTSANGEKRTIQWDGDLAVLDFNAVAYDGTVIHGTLDAANHPVKVSIAAGATVTISNATIVGVNDSTYAWAGITCRGDATIILKDENDVKGFYTDYPGIYVPEGSTLTIKGDGSLTASSNGWGAGIGGGYKIGCGNISILGGTITATGGRYCAGIGGGYQSNVCGDIYIGAGITRIVAMCGNSCSTPIGQGDSSGTDANVTRAQGLSDDEGDTVRTIISWWDGNLARVTGNMDVPDGMTLHGTLGGAYKLTIENGATVTLRDADINGDGEIEGAWAGLTCAGEATIVLDGEGENVVRGFSDDYPAIYVPEGANLFIEGDGELVAYGGGKAAGIGAGRNLACGCIQIWGGTIHAYGENSSAGIGGTSTGDCEGISIGGGNVYAYGGAGGAGIGGGGRGACGWIEIADAEVHATGGGSLGAAGIGTGTQGTCGPILIQGDSVVTALGARLGAGIGAGYKGTSDDIMIWGGYVTATGGESAAGIGTGENATCGDIDIEGIECVVATCGGECDPIGMGVDGNSGFHEIDNTLMDNTSADGKTRTLRVWNGNLAELTSDIVVPDGMTIYGTLQGKYKVSIEDNARVTVSNVTIAVDGVKKYSSYSWAGLTCLGTANITLLGSNTIQGFFEDYPGIYVPTDKTLMIRGAGSLVARSNGYGAGIGGGYNLSCGSVVIYGGTITAIGGTYAAGIGSGYYANCQNLTFNGGNVTATGGTSAAGIGAGSQGSCGAIFIASVIERIEATYGTDGVESIGAGMNGSCSSYPTIPAGFIDETSGSTRTIHRWNGDLATLEADMTAIDGMVLYGTLDAESHPVKVSIAAGATVTISNATIVGKNSSAYAWAGITCLGDATIILKDENTICGFYRDYPGLYVPGGCALHIAGDGTLVAYSNANSSNYGAPGIGNYREAPSPCGDIYIDGGTIYAYGKVGSAAIGGAAGSSCGDIVVNGGTVNAYGGEYAAGIGGGQGPADSMVGCGTISINEGEVYASGCDSHDGREATPGIGGGRYCACDGIAIGSGITRIEATYGLGSGFGGSCPDPVLADNLIAYSDSNTRVIVPWDGNLATLETDVTATDGMVLYGRLDAANHPVKVSIAAGATVTISNATILGVYDVAYGWAGITCLGDATIILESENTVRGFYDEHPGIHVPEGSTLTITGDGSLTASSNGYGAGIGGGFNVSCGNISILGGTIKAVGGRYCAGIGGGRNIGVCGDIYIGAGITRIEATHGEDCSTPIGQGNSSGTDANVTLAQGLTDDKGNPKRIIESWWNGNLADLTGDMEVPDGMTIYGTLDAENHPVKVSIAAGATVTISNATIVGKNSSDYRWAGITCLGDATIILRDENTICGFYRDYPGLYVPGGCALHIVGDGTLTAYSNVNSSDVGAPGIGNYRNAPSPCGDIYIDGGTITAYGGDGSAAIGGASGSSCGDIVVNGGTVNAYGGYYAAGIGGGQGPAASMVGCGTISINGGEVYASGWNFTDGKGSCPGIGGGRYCACDGIVIGSGIIRVEATYGLGAGFGGSCPDPVLADNLIESSVSNTRIIVPRAGYASWAAANGMTGAWNSTDASGIHNVFRYAFDKPTGAFTDPPLLDITFNAAGKAVVKTPPLVNGAGFTFTIEASDNVGGAGNVASYLLNASGETVINETGKTKRFFRLKAVEQ